jgi:hypothetical protein
MIISQLVAKGKLQQAIQLLIDAQQQDAILLMSRLNSLKRDSMLGIIEASALRMEQARLTQAILHCAGAEQKEISLEQIVEQIENGWSLSRDSHDPLWAEMISL